MQFLTLGYYWYIRCYVTLLLTYFSTFYKQLVG